MKFTKEQMVVVVKSILDGILDHVESELPSTIHQPRSTNLSDSAHSAIETGGMILAIFYSEITNDGIAIYDALEKAGKFLTKTRELYQNAWKKPNKIWKKLPKWTDSYNKLYPEWPDTQICAETFVNDI